MRPPFKVVWSRQFGVLLEFPPIIVGNRLFTVGNAGVVVALNRTTGKRVWRHDVGYLAASSPAYGDKRIYVTILERTKGVRAGRIVALNAKTGRVAWSQAAAQPQRVLAAVRRRPHLLRRRGRDRLRDAREGRQHAVDASAPRGAVKGGPGADRRQALLRDLRRPRLRDRAAHAASRSGTRAPAAPTSASARATSTPRPAVAYGRVYIGNTDGNMYSFSAGTGKLAWRRGTGSYVYASPAVAQVRDSKPTVYFGSYDGTFYALDARSGATRWTHRDGGKISGAATVVGDIVYYSNWGKRDTTGLWARSGKKAWHSARGAFNPVVSDGQTVYVTGFSSIGAFMPKTAAEERATARAEGEEGGEGEGGQEAQGGEEEGRAKKKRERRRRRRSRRPLQRRRPRRRPRKKQAAKQRNNSG